MMNSNTMPVMPIMKQGGRNHGFTGSEKMMTDIDEHNHDWLKDAIPLGIYRSSSPRLRRMVNRLFEEITPYIKVSSKARQKDALKNILTHLYHVHQLDRPARYSRDKNYYTRGRRYGQLFFKYDRLIPIIDALEQLGYIEQKPGYFFPEDEEGKQTRMWGTDKLWKAFQDHHINLTGFYKPADKEELIILRDKNKQDVGYRETPRVKRIRDDLERYNRFVKKYKISISLEGNTLVDNRFLVEDIYQNIINGKVWIKSIKYSVNNNWIRRKPLPVPSFIKHTIEFCINPKTIINKLKDIRTKPSSITQMKRDRPLLAVFLRRFWSDEHQFEKYLEKRSFEISSIPWKDRLKVLAQEFHLRDIGVEMLEIVLDYEQLHRIFNRNSWKLGGRAYGALHQDMVRRHMRKLILIDGNPTVEVDYSAYHIRMLYHMEGIDFREDPYVICEGPEMRKEYKAVGLIAINAADDISAYGAIRKDFIKRGIPFPAREKPIISLVNTFKKSHQPIAKHLFSGVGLRLQNTDSEIMDNILVNLMDKGILGLPVHDSVIAETKYEGVLREIMEREYERVMKYKPVF